MPNDDALNHILKICRDHVKQWRSNVKAMQSGKLGTMESRSGRLVDTTQETINQHLGYIKEMEETIARIKARNAK